MTAQRAFTALNRIRSRWLPAIVCSLLVFVPPALVCAAPARQTKPKAEPVPAPFIRWPDKGAEHAILVDKARQKVFIYHKDDFTSPVKTYPCSTGENEGKKSRQKDRKTPEGIYFFTNVFEQKDLAPIYGVRAFPLDYPNPMDKREGRDGYGIWFHGTNKQLKPRDSNGCIVLENHNIEDLSPYIRLNDTPVVISSKVELIDPERLAKEREELERVIEGWRKAWEGKQIEKYMSYYSPQFSAGDKDWKEWREYKTRLAKQYREIRVELHNLAIFKNDGLVMASFDQRYRTAGFDSLGVKRLFLQQNSSQWKIVGEFFGPPVEKPKVAMVKRTPPPPAVSPSHEIRNFVELWRRAWEQKDLKAYLSCYDPGFRSRGMNLRQWKDHREELNHQVRSFSIELKDLKIKEGPGDAATVIFVQDYRADAYRDIGVKNLLLTKKGPHWKIKTEDWRPLKRPARR